MPKKFFVPFFAVVCLLVCGFTASAAPKKILFFTKSSGFQHSVIAWKDGQTSHAKKALLKLGRHQMGARRSDGGGAAESQGSGSGCDDQSAVS